MERPRAHSVMHVRPPSTHTSSFQARASKLLQKVSAKFGGRASQERETANSGPYTRGVFSLDGRPTIMKPFMSQPMLALPHAREEQEDPESDGSASPARSESNARRESSASRISTMAIARPPPPSRAPPPPPVSPVNINAPAARIPASSPPVPSAFERPPVNPSLISNPAPSTSTLSVSSSTASYATAPSALSTAYSGSTMTITAGLPSLARMPLSSSQEAERIAISGLPHTLDSDRPNAPQYLAATSNIDTRRPRGAQAPADPHHHTYPSMAPRADPVNAVLTIPPSAFSDPSTRRASIASTLSATSEDSFATAQSGAETPTTPRAQEREEDAEIEGPERRTTIRASERDRADTLRAAFENPQTISVSTSDSSPTPTQTPKTQRVVALAPLQPLATVPLTIPASNSVPTPGTAPANSPASRSPTLTSPWGSSGFAPGSASFASLAGPSAPAFNAHSRARTTSAGFASASTSSFSSSASGSPRLGYSTSTGPRRVPPSLHRFSMTFNPSSGPSSPGGSSVDMRLSPSVIVRQPPLAIPVMRLPPMNGEVGATSPATPKGTIGRRSSVILGSVIAREGSVSKAVVRSIPSLAMESAHAGRAEEEEEDVDDDDEMLEDLEPEEDAPEGSRDSIDLDGRTEAESPFVPLQVDTTPFALDFGLGKGKGKEQEVAKPHRLASFATVSENSLTSQVQHKTPTPQVWRGDYFSVRTPTTDTPGSPGPFAIGPFTPAPPLAAVSRSVPMPGSPTERRPSMYKHASRSMVDVLASFGEAEAGKGKVAEWKGEAPAYDGLRHGGTVKRRRSMPEMMAAPPPYTLPLGNSHPLAQTQVVPRDDEGRETLPVYSNAILLRGEMPRKMEFSAPGVQARDRKWRRVLCELEGTAFRVYRVPKEGWWERRVGAGDVAATGAAIANAAAAASAAVKARAAAKETAQAGKIAQEEASIAAAGSGSVAEEVGEENEHGITEVVVPSRSSTSSVRSSPSAAPPQQGSPTSSEGSPTMSRPRLNLGFTLLKPRSHGRSKSDLPNPPRSPIMSRSSLSIPRPSFNSESLSPVSAAGHTSGSSLAPSRSNASLSSARSGLLSSRAPVPGSSLKGKGKAGTDIPEPDPADLIRSYTLQHAESGLGNDYVKRKHVIRVRLEGEQFLLQARDVGDVVEWIEGLHSATDIALDLDERVMPKGPMFPRRRRRRPRAANGDTGDANNTTTATLPAS